LPSEGAQSEDVIKWMNEFSFNKPVDFKIKPVAIANGSMRKKLRQTIIHLDDILSTSRLDKIIVGSFAV